MRSWKWVMGVLAPLGVLGACETLETATEGACLSLDKGSLCGTPLSGSNGTVYKGIEYAKAETWEDPVLVTSYAANTPATDFGPICAQVKDKGVIGKEDCLYLNVWTPRAPDDTATADLPVMVFIHGGAFVFGAGSEPAYDGTHFAQDQDVVMVSLNYRLGALGFPPKPSSTGGLDTNFGLKDQLTALKWVQANIAHFGGDPNQVTIFGESAGAMSVGMHLYSMPDSAPYFRAGIMESNPIGYFYPTPHEATDLQAQFASCLNASNDKKCNGATDWPVSTPTADRILAAQMAYSGARQTLPRLSKLGLPGTLPFTPFIDDTTLVQQPLEGFIQGKAADGGTPKPVLVGVNANEGVLFAGLAAKAHALEGLGLIAPTLAMCKNSRKELPLHPGRTGYWCLMDNLFIDAADIDGSNDEDKVPPFSPTKVTAFPKLNKTYSAMANAITTSTFLCPTLEGNSASTQAPVWAYLFMQQLEQPTEPATPACDPANTTAACHESELPFVFNNLDDPATSPNAPVLAALMNGAWADFAKDPMTSPIQDEEKTPLWAPWVHQDGGTVMAFGPNGEAKSGALPTLYKDAYCPQWAKTPPIVDNRLFITPLSN